MGNFYLYSPLLKEKYANGILASKEIILAFTYVLFGIVKMPNGIRVKILLSPMYTMYCMHCFPLNTASNIHGSSIKNMV